jgi:hypothetical protein
MLLMLFSPSGYDFAQKNNLANLLFSWLPYITNDPHGTFDAV